jgi:hypothetical protein
MIFLKFLVSINQKYKAIKNITPLILYLEAPAVSKPNEILEIAVINEDIIWFTQ